MRFMGFSKINFSVRFAALAMVGAFAASLGVVALPSEAEAGRRNVWSVKFKCSEDSDDLVKLTDEYDDTEDNFFLQTIVNIHNPSDRTVNFKVKVVVALRQADITGGADPSDNVSDQISRTLGSNEARALDCADIRSAFASATDSFGLEDVEDVVEGFVVIESERGSRIPELAVCANYIFASAQDINFSAGGSVEEPIGASIHVLCYDPIRARFKSSNKF